MAKTLLGNVKGPKGDTGPAGYTPIKGKDYFTEDEKKEFAPAYTYGTADLTAGSSPLATGTLYFVYE